MGEYEPLEVFLPSRSGYLLNAADHSILDPPGIVLELRLDDRPDRGREDLFATIGGVRL